MTSKEIREKFLEFFKNRGHKIVPSSSLVPDDPSVLLTTAGMQQFKRYFTGELDPVKDFGGKNTASIQKSFRTSDIDEVGDESHLTFFEMFGNFSFGGYWKKEAIEYAHEFITKEMGLKIDHVSVFGGDSEADLGRAVPADEESEKIWRALGVKDVRRAGREDNFWGPTGSEGPCGPTTEIYVRGVEIWNIVFNEYYCRAGGSLEKLSGPGIDTGMGLERLAMVSQNTSTIFETDLFRKPLDLLLRGVRSDVRSARIIADHLRASVFLFADGVRPSNKERGYILRRLIRRLLVHSRKLYIPHETLSNFLNEVIIAYGDFYSELKNNKSSIVKEFDLETRRFTITLDKGLKEFRKRYPGAQVQLIAPNGSIQPFIAGQRVGKDAFDLYQTYGFPVEVIKELLEGELYQFDEDEFRRKLDEELKKHQKISRAGSEKKFGGHGLILDTGELKAGSKEELDKVLRLHTATHLLQRALREVLGNEVHQMGSDITPERTRFDFSFSRKLTAEEISRAENLVNQKIKEDLPVNFIELPKSEAEKTGALYFFKEKYPEKVKVYYVGNDLASAWSKEFCGGPHVKRTGEIGNFRIAKEEAVSAGARRIRGTVD